MTRLSVALVLPYGDAREGYFPDTLLELCTTEARRAGHEATLCRVYYDPKHPEVGREALGSWLDRKSPDLVVVERLFDPDPIVDFVARKPDRHAVMISWGDADLVTGIDLVLGLSVGTTDQGRTRRSPGAGDLVQAFGKLLGALAEGGDVLAVPGVTRNVDGRVEMGKALEPAPLPTPFAPALDAEALVSGDAPDITRHVIFGNAGCPFALDPIDNPHYRGLPLAPENGLSRLGCAFCHAGGDYQVRPDEDVVSELVAQARYFIDRTGVRELLISDQHPVRYLETLVQEAHAAGLGSVRWLFPARADAFVRDRGKLERAIVAAEAVGQVLELYLSGFEAFSERELERYNKGVSVAELVSAVTAMRALHRAHPRAFDYARTKGHSLVLWNPWTRVEDVLASVECIREHGLGELFDEIGHNRLRLYPDLPIAHAAERDGALLSEWENGDEGAGRKKGYARERPWRFLHPETRLAWELAQRFRARLGPETEVEQLTSALEFASGREHDAGIVESSMTALEGLDATLAELSGPDRPRGSCDRGRELRATQVELGGACNNGCVHCPNRAVYRDDHSLFERISRARETGRPIVLAGREPTLFSAIDRAVELARGDDFRPVGLVTNGRRLSHAPFALRLAQAGLRHVSVKLFAPDAETADAISRDPGGFEQALAGIQQSLARGVDTEIRLRLDARMLDRIEGIVPVAERVEVRRIRIEPALDAIGIASLGAARDALLRLKAACLARDLSLVAGPLSAGARWFDRIVVSDD